MGHNVNLIQKVAVDLLGFIIIIHAYQMVYSSEINTVSYIIWLLISVGCFWGLRLWFQSTLRFGHYLILAPILILIALLLNISITIAVMMSGLAVYRLIRHEAEPEMESEKVFVGLASVAVFIGYVSGIYGGLHQVNIIVYLFLTQLLLMYLGKMIHNLSQEKGTGFKKKLYTVISVGFVTFGSAALIFALFPLFRTIYNVVTSFLLNSFIFLLSPFFEWIENIETDSESEEVIQQEEGSREEEESFVPNEAGETIITSEHLLYGFIVLVVIFIIVLLYKFRKNLMQNINITKDDDEYDVESSRTEQRKFWKWRTKAKPPENEVRKAFFKLEKWSINNGLGRYVDESIHDWLERYKIHHLIDDEVIQIYRDVRYGQHQLSTDETRRFMKQIGQVKQQLKQMIADKGDKK
ncbi:hypothetical protein [Aquisalibacillus elongatus]|uniref:DUF4129 domain-containing protein n=1 Tax=Aquisalibacillus elongatus TaxID=485577 RepID=A0A3N5C1V6_9BACI|nr:hypothetical protein [Aquisalibacillus elongatus]RPF50161.1 hypothetical protein EDC24_2979 [Aquisalibacillus elongatus]